VARIGRVNQQNKSFLFLFFKKEILSFKRRQQKSLPPPQ
jgi:hypothetical protein